MLDPAPPFGADAFPASVVTSARAFDVFGQSLKRKMRSAEGEVEKERLIVMGLRMVFEIVDRVLGDGCRRIVARARLDGRQLSIIIVKHARMKVAAEILNVVRVVESVFQGHSVNVPLARVVRSVTPRPEHLWQEPGPFRADSLGPAGHSGHG